jgi:hypothetical protein
LLNYVKIIYENLNGLQRTTAKRTFKDLDEEINWTIKFISSTKSSKTKLKIPARESCPLCQKNILFKHKITFFFKKKIII